MISAKSYGSFTWLKKSKYLNKKKESMTLYGSAQENQYSHIKKDENKMKMWCFETF